MTLLAHMKTERASTHIISNPQFMKQTSSIKITFNYSSQTNIKSLIRFQGYFNMFKLSTSFKYQHIIKAEKSAQE